ncbi:hypothetical protein [Actinobaculum massiliense]|uniref:hypothetical protein n=1 Tax=Actinobaculum massiliense TaxID=202789 RepID=UPI00071AF9D9|nr:hypothetical protein [Actinobaculum massiliense]
MKPPEMREELDASQYTSAIIDAIKDRLDTDKLAAGLSQQVTDDLAICVLIASSPALGDMEDDPGRVCLALLEARASGASFVNVLRAWGAHIPPTPARPAATAAEPVQAEAATPAQTHVAAGPQPHPGDNQDANPTGGLSKAQTRFVKVCRHARPHTPLDYLVAWATSQRTNNVAEMTDDEVFRAIAAFEKEQQK